MDASEAVTARLRLLRQRAVEAAPRAALAAMAHTAVAMVQLELTKTGSHPKGAQAAPAPAPPSVVSGSLRRSIIATPPVPLGAGRFSSSVGPTIVYGRIQEFGGLILPVHARMLHWKDAGGGDHFAKSVTLPARPYLRTSMQRYLASGVPGEVATKAFVAALTAP